MKTASLILTSLAWIHSAWAAPEIYLEDSHAGSFYWIAAHLPVNEPVTLVIIDAHSDATARPDCDSLRGEFTHCADPEALLRTWRKRGEISCDAWIEPLMPAPVNEVLWIPALSQDDAITAKQEQGARALLVAHEEVSPHDVQAIARRYHTADLAHAQKLTTKWARDCHVVVTIDLDFFADTPAAEMEKAFDAVWNFVVALDERLAGVTFAVSRPWLKSDAQASALIETALRHALSIQGAHITVEPFAGTGPDTSAMFKAYYARGETPPAWPVERASEPLRALLLAARSRLRVNTDNKRWNELLDTWDESFPVPRLSLQGRQPGADEVWRVEEGQTFSLGFDGSTLIPPDAKVRWLLKRSSASSFNLVKQIAIGRLFAADSSSLPRDEEVEIARTKDKEPLRSTVLDAFFDQATGWGLVQVLAEVHSAKQMRRTLPIAIARRPPGQGVRAAIAEGFGLPYVFGATFLHEGEFTGPETLIGADCASFVIAALRKAGHPFPWGAPADLRRVLQPLPNGTPITQAMLDEGVIVDFGTHMTLLMQDQGRRGVVDEADIVAHHLEGLPALISIGELMRLRGYKSFHVLHPAPVSDQSVKLLFGGDAMLARSIGSHPLAAIASALKDADLAIVNLECVISGNGEAVPGKPYVFRAPPTAVDALHEAGVGAVSLANNHAMDFGSVALDDMQHTLDQHGIPGVGAGKAPVIARFIKVKGLNIALIGMSDVSEDREHATTEHSGVATALDLDAVRVARQQADTVIVFMHWGTEGQSVTTARQRSLARQLVRAGADVIVGAHPHCVQPLDVCGGCPVAFSLGNLVFDGGLPGSAWNRGALMELKLTPTTGRPQSWRLIPVEIDKAGEPHFTEKP